MKKDAEMPVRCLPEAIGSFYKCTDGSYSLCSVRGREGSEDDLGELETLRLARVVCTRLATELYQKP
jgi:hypothetical protein